MNFFTRLFGKKRNERDNRKQKTDDTPFIYSSAVIAAPPTPNDDRPVHDNHHSGSSGNWDDSGDSSGSYDSDSSGSGSFDGGGDSGGGDGGGGGGGD